MGRNRSFHGHNYFSFDLEKNEATCIIDGCGCIFTSTQGKRLHSNALKWHLKKKHPEVIVEHAEVYGEHNDVLYGGHPGVFYGEHVEVKCEPPEINYDYPEVKYEHNANIKRKREAVMDEFQPSTSTNFKTSINRIPKRLTKEDVHKCAVEAVTVNGLPLNVFEKSGISKLISPIFHDIGMNLNRKFIRVLVMQNAMTKINELKAEFAGRMVCVKLDLCTRKGRHFLGVNFQVIINGRFKFVTAGVKEMNQQATAVEVRKVTRECLAKIDIGESQIYSITTDNGANVIKTSELIREDKSLWTEEQSEYDNESTIDSEYDEVMQGLTTSAEGVVTLRCAVHTFQLSVIDYLNSNETVRSIISHIRTIVRKCHTPNLKIIFKSNDIELPNIDAITRWGSTYDMLFGLHKVKSFLSQLASATNENLHISEQGWVIVEEIINSLKPVYNTTLYLQLRNITAGEFLGEWMRCKLLLKEGNFFTMLHCMEKREHLILENVAFLASVYLDPRYKCLLPIAEKGIAKQHLVTLAQHMRQNHDQYLSTRGMTDAHSTLKNTEDDDLLDRLLNESEKTEKGNLVGTTTIEIENILNCFDSTKRISREEDIFKWWESYQNDDLKRVAETALALPVTQVSLKRTFSGLKYILDEHRLNTKDDIIDAIILLRCNT